MKKRILQQTVAAFALSILLFAVDAHAGGNLGQKIATFEPAKSAAEVEQLKAGDTLVKVCRACGTVTLVRVEKGGKGVYDYVAKKCDECGSDNTYVAVSRQTIPFKEQIKR